MFVHVYCIVLYNGIRIWVLVVSGIFGGIWDICGICGSTAFTVVLVSVQCGTTELTLGICGIRNAPDLQNSPPCGIKTLLQRTMYSATELKPGVSVVSAAPQLALWYHSVVPQY